MFDQCKKQNKKSHASIPLRHCPFILNCSRFDFNTLQALLPDLFRIVTPSHRVGPLPRQQSPRTESVSLIRASSLSAVIRSAFLHQWEAAEKIPDPLVPAEESQWISRPVCVCILFDININPYCACRVFVFWALPYKLRSFLDS
jgi:hypothetical protein